MPYDDFEILFRLCNDPVSETWGAPRWQVEFHEYDGISVPVGLAWVCEYPEEYGGPVLLYLLVADQWRRQGIAKHLLRACLDRWPNLLVTEAGCHEAELLLKSVKREVSSGRWPFVADDEA